MRKAFELAWTDACIFSKSVPKVQTVDDITFKKPVVIGSILFLSSDVVYTNSNTIQVRVHASTINPNNGVRDFTNDFYFKFKVDPSVKIKKVLPKTYAESIMYLDGKRHL
jgi:acyl-coenzyme A thioesterase 9